MPIEYINNSKTFNYTKTEQTWTVPDDVTSVYVDAYGASGRFGGGKGGRVHADLKVIPKETLHIYVGGRGQGIREDVMYDIAQGGWNGGGNGGADVAESGGGATDIRIYRMFALGKVIVAGGGGGSAYYTDTGTGTGTGTGGAGGGLVGGDGGGGDKGGKGGTQTAGGRGGHYYGTNAGTGSSGIGGDSISTSGVVGGGGGGGWYGGGGGNEKGGGGGGSSYTEPSLCSNVVHEQGVQSGDGQLILQWPTVKLQQYAISGTVEVGQTLSVVKSGANMVADSATYQWQSSNDGETEWTNITSATTNNTYTINRSDRYKYLRAKIEYVMNNNVEIQEKEETLAAAKEARVKTASALLDAQYEYSVALVIGTEAEKLEALHAVNVATNADVVAGVAVTNADIQLTIAKAVEDISKTAFSNKTNLVPLETISGSTEPIKQQYAISGTVVVGQTLTVAKSGTNDVADDTIYKWQSSSNPSDTTAWSDITGATSQNYTITRGDRYKYLRVEATYSVNSRQVDTVYAAAFALVPLEGVLQDPVIFNYTEAAQTWTVPDGVTWLSVDAYGANGESADAGYGGGEEGRGGRVQCDLAVTKGEVLNIYVGGSHYYTGYKISGKSGWNGGGVAADGSSGGGATDIRIGGTDLNNRVLVAGGGGGAYESEVNVSGGDGGGLTGQAGSQWQHLGGGQGGTQYAGGDGGNLRPHLYPQIKAGADGGFGVGGSGGNVTGGGGGGGYYGGGGGEGGPVPMTQWGGGGGGSSYTDPSLCSNVIHTQGGQTNRSSTESYIRTDGRSLTQAVHGQLILQWSEPIKQQYAISGTVVVGQTLTVAKSGTNNVADYTIYKWQSSSNPSDTTAWSDITGATSQNYTITRGDRYKYLRVEATYSVNSRQVDTVYTAATVLVPLETISGSTEPIKQQYSISGTNVTGAQLSVIKNSSDVIVPSVDDQYTTYQWQSSSDGTNWTNITDATSSTFIPDDSYADKQIKALVTYNMKSLVDQVFQVETAAAVTMNLFDTSQYTWSVSGTVDFEEPLTVSKAGSGEVTGTPSYQWQSSNDGKSGWEGIGPGTTYQIKGKDQNKHIRVEVTYRANGQAIDRTFPKKVSTPVPNFVNQDYTIHETGTTAPNKDVTNSTSQIGKTLSVFTRTDPTVDKDGESDTTYQWQRYDGTSSWNNITGATNKTYAVMGPDENKKLRAKVSFHYSGLGPITVDTTNEIEIDDFVLQDYIVTGEAENGKKLTVNETEKKLPVGTIDSISYQWQCSSDDGISWTNVGTDNKKYTVEDQNKLIRVKVTFGISTLQITNKVVTVNVQQPDFIIFGLEKDAVNLDNTDARDEDLSNVNIKSTDGTVVNDKTKFTGANLKGVDTTRISAKVSSGTVSLSAEKRTLINLSRAIRTRSFDLRGKDLRGYDLRGMRITSLEGAIINSNTNLSRIDATGANMNFIVK